MKSLGIDLSLRQTGWGFINDDGGVITDVVKTDKDDFRGPGELVRRVRAITLTISEIVQRYAPNTITIEGYAMQGKGRVFDLAELSGALKQSLFYTSLPSGDKPAILICSPSSLKAFAGHGKADKDQMRAYAAQYGHDFTNDNKCDAFFLALAGLCAHNSTYCSHQWTKKQLATVKGFDLIRAETKARTR